MEVKTCSKCKETKLVSEYYKRANRGYTLQPHCKSCCAKTGAVSHKKISVRYREIVIANYGGKCACCGELEPLFLTIDHKNNDGAEDRRNRKSHSGRKFYKQIINEGFPECFQILCWNCNSGRFRNGGVCPHASA